MTTHESTVCTDGTEFRTDEAFAHDLDAADELAPYRDRFCIPRSAAGAPVHYFCGNSLGLAPKSARRFVEAELDKWETLAVDAHFADDAPWYSYHELFRDSAARLVGARPGEVVMMNSLTVNLHLMMVSFYRPTDTRFKILMEAPAFPSDMYAVETQIRSHGLDPEDALLVIQPRDGEHSLRHEDIEATLERDGDNTALVLFAGVNFLSGQLLDMQRITQAAHRRGCRVGFDLAHTVGNVPLALHDWDVDFAVWCTYKYLNSSPGAIAGCFVHERNGKDTALPRFGGWWGNDPATRFRMQLESSFIPRGDADGWQLSNPPILAMAPLRASLEIFEEAGMERLRAKSVRLTAYLWALLEHLDRDDLVVITPVDARQRGCQLSILVNDRPRDTFQALAARGCVADFREPNVIRVAPVPLYNTFHDVWKLADAIASLP